MADRTITVVTPASSIDFLTLDECKMLLGIPLTDTSQDALLAMLISQNSAVVAAMCNRTFAQEDVIESWRDVMDRRLFLSHWPVKQIDSVTQDGAVLDPSGYELETNSGKTSIFFSGPTSTWTEPAVVTYTGGYILPDEAPLDLKQAAAILIREEKIRMQQAQVAGIRSISHKESRVMFFDPNAILLKLGGKSPGMQAVDNLLKHYMRFEV